MTTTRVRYGDHPSQWVDVSTPDEPTDAPWPVIVVLHGGYWRDVHAADQVQSIVADLLDSPVATATVEYRRLGNDPVHGGGGWPGTFLDVAGAIDALAGVDRRRDWLDLSRVVAVGHSAGGQLAAWAAARPGLPAGSPGAAPRVRLTGYVSLAGVLDLVAGADARLDDGAVRDLLGGGPQELATTYALASPSARLPIGVPGICLHGTEDDRVPLQQSVGYVDAAVAAGDSCRLITLPGVDHFAYLDPTTPAWQQARAAAIELLDPTRR